MGRELGQAVRRLRQMAGYTQEEMERRTGLDQGYFSRLEAGRIGSPRIDVVTRIARALNCSVSELLRAAGIEAACLLPMAA